MCPSSAQHLGTPLALQRLRHPSCPTKAEKEGEVSAWGTLREALIQHFTIAVSRREVGWLKTRRQCRYHSWLRARAAYGADAGLTAAQAREADDQNQEDEHQERFAGDNGSDEETSDTEPEVQGEE